VDRYGVVVMPLLEEVAEDVAKVLEKTCYDREEMRRYAFEKFSGSKERFLFLLPSLAK
jgi:hypothetical protein